MSFVMDSSVTLAWIYSEEPAPGVRQVFARLEESGAWVPGLWRLEVANALEMDVRRGRRDARFRDQTLSDLALWPVKTDAKTDRQAWKDTLRLAIQYRLTMYDAAYLELAVRRALPMATLDRDLGQAAQGQGVTLLVSNS